MINRIITVPSRFDTLAPAVDRAEIERAVRVLFSLGEVVEVRIPKTPRAGTVAGYFDDRDKLVTEVVAASARYPTANIYWTLNRLDPALIARSVNRLKERAEPLTADHNVIRRTRLPVDIDAVRPSGISSTDEQKRLAIDRAYAIARALEKEWGRPLIGDSGNGAGLIYALDLTNDEESLEIIKAVLAWLDGEYSDEHVKVDLTSSNAARIWKVFGTVARKGDHTKERPHRTSCILEAPKVWRPIENLERFRPRESVGNHSRPAAPGSQAPSPQPEQAPGEFDIDAYLARYGWTARKKHWSSHPGGWLYELAACPFNTDHVRGSAVFTLVDARPGFRCQHDGCTGKTIQDVFGQFPPEPAAGVRSRTGHRSSPNGSQRGGRSAAFSLPQKIPQSRQHLALVRLTGALRRYRVCEPAILDCLLAVNELQCEKPSPAEDVERIVRSTRSWSVYEPKD